MAAFTELDWRRLDAFAIIVGRGMATVAHEHKDAVASWLDRNGYETTRLDFTHGISPVVEGLGQLLGWEREFGYVLEGASRNLAALHDGFHFDPSPDGGLVLEISGFDKALQENKDWSMGFLSIVSEHSLRQMAVARRFFALLLVQDDQSSIVGRAYEELCVPYPFHMRVPKS